MARVEDLVDLIETTNEIYLVNPRRNIRSAYIQIDDLCELTIKSFLQENVPGWVPYKGNNPQDFKSFHIITNEIKNQFPAAHLQHAQVNTLVGQIKARRDNRNHFFHDHQQTGLTVNDEQCLKAFCDLYELMDVLFRNWSTAYSKPLLNVQIAVMKLKLNCIRDLAKERRYADMLVHWRCEDRSNLRVASRAVAITYSEAHYEYMVIRFDPDKFLSELTTRGLI